MKHVYTVVLFCFFLFTQLLFSQPNIWINEFHYDNVSGDVDEFVEVVVPQGFSDLENVTLSLYREDGTVYGTHTLDTFTEGVTNSGCTIFSKLISGLQNGPNDGFALDYSGILIQFLSYEGLITGTDGVASGATSEDVGVLEDGTTPEGFSLQLMGSGSSYAELTWTGPLANTRGAVNSDQSLPVSLSSFTALAGDNSVTLRWVTESEVNNAGFEVCRADSEQGKYTVIASYLNNENLKGQINSNTRHEYSYTDILVVNGKTYWYQLVDVDLNGNRHFHGPVSATPDSGLSHLLRLENMPERFVLYQNFPNPFNPSTSLKFDVPPVAEGSSHVNLSIYNDLGQLVKVLYENILSPGTYSLQWNGRDREDQLVPSGVYYGTLKTGRYQKTIKMMLIR
jgi:hypothetical protein